MLYVIPIRPPDHSLNFWSLISTGFPVCTVICMLCSLEQPIAFSHSQFDWPINSRGRLFFGGHSFSWDVWIHRLENCLFKAFPHLLNIPIFNASIYFLQNDVPKWAIVLTMASKSALWYWKTLWGDFLFRTTRELTSRRGISWSDIPGMISHQLTMSGVFVRNMSSVLLVVDVVLVGLSTIWVKPTLPGQWSLITISQYNHSFHPMFPTDHCRLVSIFRRKVRWRSEHVYTRITDTCCLT